MRRNGNRQHWRFARQWQGWLLRLGCLIGVIMTACTSAATTTGTAITFLPPQPLTFYEGEDDIEPFTPFLAAPGSPGTVMTFGFAEREGAYYVTTYNAQTWAETGISNGFAPTDPLWDCDATPETGTTFAAAEHLVARTCVDGSVTVFSLPDALPLWHVPGSPGNGALTARIPAIAFAPRGNLLAFTNDGPRGPGDTITLMDTQTWQAHSVISVSAGLLSRPAWSPDGQRLAAVDLEGTLHIWDATTGAASAQALIPNVQAASAAADPAVPAPRWSPDSQHLYVTLPTKGGTHLSAWSLPNATTLRAGPTFAIPYPAEQVNPQLSPSGTVIFVHSGNQRGQLLRAADLTPIAAVALPGNLVVWGPDDQHLDVFTLQATVVVVQIGHITNAN